MTADGHVTVTDAPGNVAFSDHVVLTDHMRDGALQGFGALIGKNGRLAAASAQRVGGTMVIAHQTVYSPCKICNQPGQRTPLWQVKAERVVYDQVKHRIHFTDATLDLFGVPVLYTPVLSEPDPTVHYASGLLTPDIGNSTKIGYFARLPFISRSRPANDLTVAPQFSTSGGEVVESGISRPLEQWRHVAAGHRSPTIPMAGWAAAPGRRSMTICSAPGALRSIMAGRTTMAGAPVSTPSSPTTAPICASTTFPISTG